jgi:penicillin-binding protein 1A
METALRGTPEMAMRMPEGVIAINIDPTTGTRDDSGILEYFYHENPPPLVEPDLPPLFDGGESSDEPSLNTLSQPQQILQPEIVLPNKPAQIGPPPPSNGKTDAQGNAAKLLNTN